MTLKEDYLKDLNLFKNRTERVAQLFLGDEKDKCEAMWFLGCLHEICNQRINELNVTDNISTL